MMKHLFTVFLLLLSISMNAKAIDQICKVNIDRVMEHDFSDLHNPNHLEIIKNNLSSDYSNIKVISDSTVIFSSKESVKSKILSDDQRSKLLKKEKIILNYHIDNNKTFILSPVFDITGRYMSGILILGYKKENITLSDSLESSIDLFGAYLSQFLHECKGG